MREITKKRVALYLEKYLLKQFEQGHIEEVLYTSEILLEFYKKINKKTVAKKYLEISILIQILESQEHLWNIDDTKESAGKKLVTEMSKLFQFYYRRTKSIKNLTYDHRFRKNKLDYELQMRQGEIYYKKFLENFRRLYPDLKLNFKSEIRLNELEDRASSEDPKLFIDSWSYSFSYIDSPSCGISLTAQLSVVEKLLEQNPNSSIAWQIIDSIFDVTRLGYPMDYHFDFSRSWYCHFIDLSILHNQWSCARKGIKSIVSLGKIDDIRSLSSVAFQNIVNCEKEFKLLLPELISSLDVYNNWCEDISFHIARQYKDLAKALQWNNEIIQDDQKVASLKYFIFESQDQEIKKHSHKIFKIFQYIEREKLIYETLDQVIDELRKIVRR